MADCEQGKKLPEKTTIGQFEFSFISTTTPAAKDIPKSAKNHVTLHSIEIHTKNGLTPLVIQSENKMAESSVVIEKTDTEETKLHFMKELENQMKERSSSSVQSTKLIQQPSSFSDLSHYRNQPSEQQGGSIQIDIHDGTIIQILNTISKLPSSLHYNVLYYLKAVEEEYEQSLSKSS